MEIMRFQVTSRGDYERLRVTSPDTLTDLERAARFLAEGSDANVREVFTHLRDLRLVPLEPRILRYLEEVLVAREVEANDAEDEEGMTREIASIDALMRCPAQQFSGYRNYTQQLSPFSTHQGIKGAEFERVLVVLDDDECTHVQFSYDEFFVV